MDRRLFALIIFLITVGSTAAYSLVSSNLLSVSESEIACPKDGSPYVSTPIGSRSENFLW